MLYAISEPPAALADDLLISITGVLNLLLDGRCPQLLGEFVTSAPLTPHDKA